MAQYHKTLKYGIRYYYKFCFNGKIYRSNAVYHTKKEAAQFEREKYAKLDEERRYGKLEKPILLSQAIKDRINFVSIKYSKGHANDTEYYLTRLIDALGDMEVRTITRKMVENFLIKYSSELFAHQVGNYQVNAALKCIKAMFNWIIDRNELAMRNPCHKITPFSILIKFKYIPPDYIIEKVKTLVNPRQRLLIDCLLETGIRVNEALHLEFSDIKEDYMVVYTRKSKNSNRVPRKIPIPKCFEGMKGYGLVFPEWKTTPKFLDHVLRKNNMDVFGFHSFRHRYASLLSKQGVPIFEIMNLLGHHNLKTTQGYLQMLS